MEDTRSNLPLLSRFSVPINWKNLETWILWRSIWIKAKSISCQLVKAFLLPPASTALILASVNFSELFSIPQIHCKFCNVFLFVVALCVADRTFDTGVCRRVHNTKSPDSWATLSDRRYKKEEIYGTEEKASHWEPAQWGCFAQLRSVSGSTISSAGDRCPPSGSEQMPLLCLGKSGQDLPTHGT